jgi:hypothetical protein
MEVPRHHNDSFFLNHLQVRRWPLDAAVRDDALN